MSQEAIKPSAKVKLRPLSDEIRNLPNVITMLRIAVIPVILLTIDNYSPRMSALSALIFAVAAATDFLDGYLARRLGLVTVLGKFLDPLADKIIVLSTLVMLVSRDRVPGWLVVVLMVRELAINGLRAVASQEGFVIAAGMGGKIKTNLQLIGIGFVLVHFRYEILFFDVVLDFHQVGLWILYASLVISVLSAIEYFRFFAMAAEKQAATLGKQGNTNVSIHSDAQGVDS